MRAWMIESGIAAEDGLVANERSLKDRVRVEQRRAWADYNRMLKREVDEAIGLLTAISDETVQVLLSELKSLVEPSLKEVYGTVRRVIRFLRETQSDEKSALLAWYKEKQEVNRERYNSYLFSETAEAPQHVPVTTAAYGTDSKPVDGREVLNACFDANFARDVRIVAFGED